MHHSVEKTASSTTIAAPSRALPCVTVVWPLTGVMYASKDKVGPPTRIIAMRPMAKTFLKRSRNSTTSPNASIKTGRVIVLLQKRVVSASITMFSTGATAKRATKKKANTSFSVSRRKYQLSSGLLIATCLPNAVSKLAWKNPVAAALRVITSVPKGSGLSGAKSNAERTLMTRNQKTGYSFVTRTRCNKSNGKRTGAFTRMRTSKIATGMTMMKLRVSFSFLESSFCSLFCLLLASSHTSSTNSLKIPKSTKLRSVLPS